MKRYLINGGWLKLVLGIALIGFFAMGCAKEEKQAEQGNDLKPPITSPGTEPLPVPSQAPRDESPSSPPGFDPSKPAKISIFNAGDDLLEAIGQKFPHYTVTSLRPGKGSELPDLVTTGTVVDLYVGSIGAINNPLHLLGVGMEYDMTDLVAKRKVDLDRFEPALLEAVRNFGGLYGLPLVNNVMVLYYNKELFDKFGVDYPKDGLTWAETREISQRLTTVSEGRAYYGFNTSVGHYYNVNQYGLPYVDHKTMKAVVDNEAWKKMSEIIPFSFMHNTSYATLINGNNGFFPNAGRMFTEEKHTAMYAYFISSIAEQAMQAIDFDITALPVMADLPDVGSQAYPTYLCITVNSQVKDEVMEIIKYLTSDEYQSQRSKQGIALPVLTGATIKEAYGTESPWKDKNLQAAFYHPIAPAMYRTAFDNHVQAELLKVLPKVITGQADLNSALREAEEASNRVIAEAR